MASDTPENLTKLFAGTTTVHLEAKGTREETEKALESVSGIGERTIRPGETGTTLAEIRPAENADIREALFLAFAKAGLPLLEMRTARASLEDVFLELTQGDGQPAQPKDPAPAAEAEAASHEPDGAEAVPGEAIAEEVKEA